MLQIHDGLLAKPKLIGKVERHMPYLTSWDMLDHGRKQKIADKVVKLSVLLTIPLPQKYV